MDILGWRFGESKKPAVPAKPPFNPIPAMIQPRILWLPSPNRSKGRTVRGVKGKKIKARIELIVLHATVGSFVSAVDWLRKGDRPNKTSCHYIVSKDGGIVQIVDEADTSWHAGYGKWHGRGAVNARSVGIELENKNDGRDPYPAEQIQAAMWLCFRISRDHGVLPHDVVGHFHVDNRTNSKGVKVKTDPARFPWERFRKSLEAHLKGLA